VFHTNDHPPMELQTLGLPLEDHIEPLDRAPDLPHLHVATLSETTLIHIETSEGVIEPPQAGITVNAHSLLDYEGEVRSARSHLCTAEVVAMLPESVLQCAAQMRMLSHLILNRI
jgi:hypothetical protein